MRFGDYLVTEGLATQDGIARALAEQRRRQVPLGLLAIHSGVLDPDDVHRLLKAQTLRRTWIRFGELAVQMRMLEPEQVTQLLQQQVGSRPRLGQILIENGVLGSDQLASLLRGFHSWRQAGVSAWCELPA